MKATLIMLAVTLVCGGAVLALQEGEDGQEEMLPKPGEHHDHLKPYAGSWEAEGWAHFDPSQPKMEFKGSEESSLICGGLWLVSDFKGTFAGMPFSGHGVTGFDSKKKKYVGNWVDAFGDYMVYSEGACAKDGKEFSMMYEVKGPDGEVMKQKQVSMLTGADTKTIKFYTIMDGGEEVHTMQLDFKRKKK